MPKMIRMVGAISTFVAVCWLGGCKSAENSSARDSWLTSVLYPHRFTETTARARQEHHQTVKEVIRRDQEGFMDDLDLLFMTDRPTRLSKWHDR